MSCNIGVNQFFGANPYIKFLNGDIVAIDGPNTIERLIGNVKIPYQQVLRGRIILKAGQIGYLMNHLGLGDNATFIAIIATYDTKSVNEEDNYLEFYYIDHAQQVRYMDQIMILTGNSTHRIPQLYFNNPNSTYKVTLDIMVANIDDTYTFFNDTTNQSGSSFYNLQCNATNNDIETFIADESVVVYASNTSPRNPLIYLVLQDISSIHITGKILVIDENTLGRLYLEFISIADAQQAFSLLNYVSNNPGVIIQNLSPVIDEVAPIAYFYQHIDNVNTENYIEFNGSTASAYDTSYGLTFSTSLSLSTYGSVSGASLIITKDILADLIIATISDNRDGLMVLSDSNLILNYSASTITEISSTGTYSLSFNVTDIAGNSINTNTKITLSITT